jgi:hypothetical protein
MKFHPLSARFLFFKKAQKIGQKIKISPYPFSPHFHGSFMGHAILPTRIQTITICQIDDDDDDDLLFELDGDDTGFDGIFEEQ